MSNFDSTHSLTAAMKLTREEVIKRIRGENGTGRIVLWIMVRATWGDGGRPDDLSPFVLRVLRKFSDHCAKLSGKTRHDTIHGAYFIVLEEGYTVEHTADAIIQIRSEVKAALMALTATSVVVLASRAITYDLTSLLQGNGALADEEDVEEAEDGEGHGGASGSAGPVTGNAGGED